VRGRPVRCVQRRDQGGRPQGQGLKGGAAVPRAVWEVRRHRGAQAGCADA